MSESNVAPQLDLTPSQRRKLLARNRGLILRVAADLGVNKATVSKVFHGKIVHSPAIQEKLTLEIQAFQSSPENKGRRA